MNLLDHSHTALPLGDLRILAHTDPRSRSLVPGFPIIWGTEILSTQIWLVRMVWFLSALVIEGVICDKSLDRTCPIQVDMEIEDRIQRSSHEMLIVADTCYILQVLPIERQKVTGYVDFSGLFPITHRTLAYMGLSHIWERLLVRSQILQTIKYLPSLSLSPIKNFRVYISINFLVRLTSCIAQQRDSNFFYAYRDDHWKGVYYHF